MSARPTYSDEFKADAVELVVSSGRSPASVAPELGISVTALKRWVRVSREGQPGGGGKPDDPVDPAKYKALEPNKMLTIQGRKEAFELFRPDLRARPESNR